MTDRSNIQTQRALAAIVAERHDITTDEAERFIGEMFTLVRNTLATDDQVKVRGLGTFKVTAVRERASVSVNTGERVTIDAHTRITFTPDASMRESVNKPFAHFETVPLNDGVEFTDISDSETETTPTETVAKEEETVTIAVEEPPATPPEEEPQPIEPQQPAAFDEQPPTETIPEPEPQAPQMTHYHDTDDEDDERTTTTNHASVGVLLIALLCLVVGVIVGRATADITFSDVKALFTPAQPKVRVHVVYTNVPKRQKPQAAPQRTERKDTATAHVATPAVKDDAARQPEADSFDRYNSDRRLRFGAYRIVGVQQTVTVKAGQTMASIARSHLGPGMESYLEVLNGTSEVKEGQKIKIPELKTKKSLRKK